MGLGYTVYGIDPGTEKSAYVRIDPNDRPVEFKTVRNIDLIQMFKDWDGASVIAIEKVASFMQTVGNSTFETVHWSGRFYQELFRRYDVHRIERKDIKMHLLQATKGGDPQIKAALEQRFGPKGTKALPGILYGIKGHEWAALAVAVTFIETKKLEKLGKDTFKSVMIKPNDLFT